MWTSWRITFKPYREVYKNLTEDFLRPCEDQTFSTVKGLTCYTVQ